MIKKVILYPSYTMSRSDGDEHYIGAAQLRQLYGVLPTDEVQVRSDNIKDRIPKQQHEQMMEEGWIELHPLYSGNYYNIHET